MAENIIERSYVNDSGSDLYPFRFVKLKGSDSIDVCGAGELAIGVSLRNFRYKVAGQTPFVYVTPDGKEAPVRLTGIVEVECGGNVSVGDIIASDANGKAVKISAGQYGNGIALEAGEDGSRIKILITHVALTTS